MALNAFGKNIVNIFLALLQLSEHGFGYALPGNCAFTYIYTYVPVHI